jgi:hypothetical protein
MDFCLFNLVPKLSAIKTGGRVFGNEWKKMSPLRGSGKAIMNYELRIMNGPPLARAV